MLDPARVHCSSGRPVDLVSILEYDNTIYDNTLADSMTVHWQNRIQPYAFGAPSLTDDPDLASTSETIIKNLGTIQMKLIRVTRQTHLPKVAPHFHTGATPVLNEKSKKAMLSHQAQYVLPSSRISARPHLHRSSQTGSCRIDGQAAAGQRHPAELHRQREAPAAHARVPLPLSRSFLFYFES